MMKNFIKCIIEFLEINSSKFFLIFLKMIDWIQFKTTNFSRNFRVNLWKIIIIKFRTQHSHKRRF